MATFARGPRTIRCDVSGLAHPDVAAIDLLARVELAARKHGCELRLHRCSPELRELIRFVGLDGVLCVEPRRETEEWEDPLRVEEERELRDASIGDL